MKKRNTQILIGASSPNKLGWFKKISLETTQSCRISDSDNWTCFPGFPLTSNNLSIISSRTACSILSSFLEKKTLFCTKNQNFDAKKSMVVIRERWRGGGDRHNCIIVFWGWPGIVDGDVLSIEGCRFHGVGRIWAFGMGFCGGREGEIWADLDCRERGMSVW